MFHLAVFTDEVSQDPERAAKLALEFDLEGVEIRSVWNTQPHDLSEQQIAELTRLLQAYNLKVCSIASPFLKCNLGDQEAYRQHLDLLRRCISLGKQLGTNIIRGFTCWQTEDSPAVWAEVEQLYRQVIPLLESEDAIIGIENEHDTTAATAALTAQFLARLNHPRVRAIWDTANEVFASDGERPFPEGYTRLRPYMVHAHVKDAYHDAAGQPHVALIGQGAVDFKGQFAALTQSGYRGWVSLETHWRHIQLPDEMLKRPGGEAYSHSGEEATRRCLAALVEMLPAK